MEETSKNNETAQLGIGGVSGSASVDLFGNQIIKDELLKDRFGEVPFTILDSRSGNWKRRKQKWLKLNIKSEAGRKDFKNNTKANNFANMNNERYDMDSYHKLNSESGYASIFNPALAELLYNWFLEQDNEILDPFAGGSVRGIVANYLGFKYTGIDIRQEQIDSNREQCLQVLPVNNQPQYYVGDSSIVLDEFIKKFDCVFTCPPYVGLEVYSDLQVTTIFRQLLTTDNNMKNIYQIAIIILLIALIFSTFNGCETDNEYLKIQSDNETLKAEKDNLLKSAGEKMVIHDSIYLDRVKVKHHYINIIDSVRVIDSTGQVELNKLLYPTVDSANLTYFHYLSAREQLGLMDSLYVIDSLTILDLSKVIQKDSAIHANDSLMLSDARKQGTKKFWKGFKIGFGTGYAIGRSKKHFNN
jgi:hypothetical protein